MKIFYVTITSYNYILRNINFNPRKDRSLLLRRVLSPKFLWDSILGLFHRRQNEKKNILEKNSCFLAHAKPPQWHRYDSIPIGTLQMSRVRRYIITTIDRHTTHQSIRKTAREKPKDSRKSIPPAFADFHPSPLRRHFYQLLFFQTMSCRRRVSMTTMVHDNTTMRTVQIGTSCPGRDGH